MTSKQNKQIEALKEIKSILKSCKTKRVFAKVTHVSSSGMSRNIAFYVFSKKTGNVYYLSWLISKALGYRYNDNDCSIHVGGCGMDMIFNTLYNLNSVALNYGLIRTSKNHNNHDLRYHGLVETSYGSL